VGHQKTIMECVSLGFKKSKMRVGVHVSAVGFRVW